MTKGRNKIAFVLALSFILSAFSSLSVFANTSSSKNDETVFYLVRHGKTIMNTLDLVQGWTDSVVTDVGIAGAEETAYGLRNVKFEAVYSSDRGRTIETANAILEQNKASKNLNLIQLKEFRETNYGFAEGQPNGAFWGSAIKIVQERNPGAAFTLSDVLNVGAETVGGGFENGAELNQRIMRGLDQVIDNSNGGNILVVAHGNVIQSILENIGYTGDNHVDNSSVTKIIYKDGKFTISSVNDLSYMEEGKAKRAENGGILVEKEDITKINSYSGTASKTSVYLVPNTETFFESVDKVEGFADSLLTNNGELDAVSLGLGLKDVKFDRVYTSDLGRNIYTTEIIIDQNNSKTSVNQLEGLRDLNHGKYEVSLKSDYNKAVTELTGKNNYDSLSIADKKAVNDILAKNDTVLAFETSEKFDKRVNAAMTNIVNELSYNGGGNILVVADDYVISDILLLAGSENTNVTNGVTVLTYDNGKVTAKAVNDSTYLANGKKLNPYKTTTNTAAYTSSAAKVSYNGEVITFKNKPITVDNTTLYPIKEVVEKLGGKVYWNAPTKEVIAIVKENNVSYNAGTNKYYQNRHVKFMNNGYCVVYKNGVAYAPIEYISKPLSVNCKFDSKGNVYTLSK